MTQGTGATYEHFPSTHWSLIERAGAGPSDAKRLALTALLKQYLPALRCHLIYGRRLDEHTADDVLQAFTANKVLEQDLVRKAQRSRGRFRNFLLVALNHFLSNYLRAERARSCPPDRKAALDEALAIPNRGADNHSFDLAWARRVLAEALQRMQEQCRASARPDIWGMFEARVLRTILYHSEPEPYEALVRRFEFVSPTQASNVLVTANRMFVRLLRSVIREYARDDAEIDDEIADLRSILAAGARSGWPEGNPCG